MVFRVQKTKDYTVMSNYHLRDKRLSLKAKGLLSWMLSNNEDWDYSIKGIVASCKESETAIKSTLQELKQLNYLIIKKCPSDSIISTFHYEYIVYEKPVEGEDPAVETPEVENPPLEDPSVENPLQINTIERSIKERNTKERNKKEKGIRVGNAEVETFKDLYNEHCNKLPRVRQLSDKRIKAIKELVRKYTVEEIVEVFDKANSSAFLTGNNDRGWTADIDFILREDKFLNILEGKYGGKKTNRGADGLVIAPRVTKEERDNEYIYKF